MPASDPSRPGLSKVHYPMAALAYLALILIVTYPLLRHFNTAVAGGYGDAMQFIWAFWHFKNTVLQGSNPFIAENIFYPIKVYLVLHVMTATKSILSIPLQAFLSLPATYNVLYFYSFVMSGLGMYSLTLSYVNDKRLAFISGFIFAFAPNQLSHAFGHFNVISTEAIPWLLLTWKSHWEKPRLWKTGALIGLGIYLFFCDYQLFAYVFLLTCGYFAYHLKKSRQAAVQRIMRMLPAAVAFSILLIPFWWMVFTLRHEYDFSALHNMGWGGADVYCLDFLSLLIPAEGHPWWGKLAKGIYSSFRVAKTGSGYGNMFERTGYFGYVVLGTMIYGSIRYRTLTAVRQWTWVGLAFFLLALGPYFHFMGYPVNAIPGLSLFSFHGIKVTIPMPYTVIHYLPFINGARIPARFIIMTILAAALIFALVWHRLLGLLKLRPWMQTLILSTLFLVIYVEYLPIYQYVYDLKIPKIFEIVKADANKNHVVLDLPTPPWSVYHMRSYYHQPYHGHKMVGGWTARNSKSQVRYINSLWILRDLAEGDAEKVTAQAVLEVIRRLDITYIAAHRKQCIDLLKKIQPDIPGLELRMEAEDSALWIYHNVPVETLNAGSGGKK